MRSGSRRGGDGNDTIRADEGYDTLHGNNHHDSIRGGNGNDSLYGQDGTDTIRGDAGPDSAHGGPGKDTCRAETGVSCWIPHPPGGNARWEPAHPSGDGRGPSPRHRENRHHRASPERVFPVRRSSSGPPPEECRTVCAPPRPARGWGKGLCLTVDAAYELAPVGGGLRGRTGSSGEGRSRARSRARSSGCGHRQRRRCGPAAVPPHRR
ncbi:calcium-binding protein [Kocuria sp. U4B]